MALSTKFLAMVALISLLILGPLDLDIATADEPVVPGLSYSFYDSICPNLEYIVRHHLVNVFNDDIGQAAGLLRLHFHDCFVQGCDGSVLLDGSTSGPSEQSAIPNLTLRARAFKIINDLRHRVHRECGQVVSCADIVALAARDSVVLTGGPNYKVPFGRRDSTNFATLNVTLNSLVAPTSNTTTVLQKYAVQNLDATDAVALSGAHTIGLSHCGAFAPRLFPTVDPTLDPTLANNLLNICPAPTTNATTVMDFRSPNLFDNNYFIGLLNGQGLFTSDEDLFLDDRTSAIVSSFAANQSLFFEKFVVAIVKMGQLNVLTGDAGEIRANCSARNQDNYFISSVVEDGEGSQASQF